MFNALLALDFLGGRIERIDLADGAVTTIVSDTGPAPDGVGYDAATDRIYWTTMGRPEKVSAPTSLGEDYDFSKPNGSVRSARLDGSDIRVIVPSDGTMTTGKQLTLDSAAGYVYFADREGSRVSRVGMDGAGKVDLVVNLPTDDPGNNCVGVAVDSANGHLYWTQKGRAKSGEGRILGAGLAIPTDRTAEHRTDIETLWRRLPEPIDLEIDPIAGYLYWTDRGAPPNGNTLNRAPLPKPGDHGLQPEILADGFAEAIGLTVDFDARIAYVADLGGTIRAVALDGSGSDRVLVHRDKRPFTGITGV
ncbi:hypothetical protein [Nocardia altamirensis]|uniref:hypothetical protein n=1 Tax=Nocardia altamirensis TaxID=472158 RepID=UPI00084056CA|nr:hypothetical protein [Nocardia altamirensis]